jgi:hypothetical protein
MAVTPSAPDQGPDAVRFHDDDIQSALQRDRLAQAKMMDSVRRILRRILGRRTP